MQPTEFPPATPIAAARAPATRAGTTAATSMPASLVAASGGDVMSDLRARAGHRSRFAHVAAIAIIVGFHVAGLLPAGHMAVTLALLVAVAASVSILPARAQADPDAGRTIAALQGGTAVTGILVAMHGLVEGHAILMTLYMLALMMSPSPWNGRNLGWLAAYAMVGDLVVFAAQHEARLARMPLQIEALRWLALGLMLAALTAAISRFIEAYRRLVHTNEQLVEAAATIQSLVTRDELTGVFNRRRLVEVLDAEAARRERHDVPLAVCLIDLDHFKRVNDTLGHAAGDAVLRECARAIERSRRPTDVFGRYGGEEFMLVLPHEDVAGARQVAERVRATIAGLQFPGLPDDWRVTVSIGVAGHARGTHWQDMVNRADAALYRAKAGGRDRVEVDAAVGAVV